MSLLLTLQVRYSMVQLDYLVHKEYIVSELCVERDIPDSTCEGKCHLKKELSKLEEQHDEKGNAPIQIPINSIDFIADYDSTDLNNAIAFQVIHVIDWCDGDLLKGASLTDSPPPELSAIA